MAASLQATAATGDARRTLLGLRDAGRRDELIDLGYRYLEASEDDAEVALAVCRALVESGLGEPARELLGDRADLAAARASNALEAALAAAPSGRVPRAELADRFEANLASLVAGRPHLRGLTAALRDAAADCDFFRDAAGALHPSRRAPGRLRRWIPAFRDPAADGNVETPLGPAGPPTAVLGTATSRLARRVYELTRPRPDDRAAAVIFIIDDDLFRVVAWLHATDLTELLRDARVELFAGSTAASDLKRRLAVNEDLPPPQACVAAPWAASLAGEVARVVGEVAADRGRALADLAGRLRRRAAERSRDDWLARLRPGADVVGFASRATTMLQYSLRDVGHALEALGYNFHLLIEGEDHRRHSTLTTARAVWETDPALVVIINHFRREQPHAFGAGPLLTWVQDPTDAVLSRDTGAALGPLDFVCGYYRQRCVEEFGYPADRFFTAPLPASQRTFHDGPAGDGGDDDCDVMYAGHLHETADEHVERWRALVPAPLRDLLEALRAAVEARHDGDEHLSLRGARRLVAEIAGGGLDADQQERLATYFAFRLYDILYRRQTLLWTADWAQRGSRRFRLYGRGWSRDPALGRFAAGPVEHGEPLRRAYRRARLVIQTVPGAFTHQRTFEALLSGSLVLGRRIPADFQPAGATRWFPDLDRVVFRDAGELAQVADRFVSDDDLRQRTQAAFADVVRNEFTYTVVLRRVLEAIRAAGTETGPAAPDA